MSQSPAAPPTASRSRAPEAFARLIDGFRVRVDREIAAFLAAKGAATGGRSTTTSAAGRAELSDPSDLVDGLSRLMVQGGKRLRPALVYYTYRACGGRCDELALPVALATEFLHTYLLIHDDIMDHAQVRRGQPAAQVRFSDLHRQSGLRGDADDFGRSVAILLGDLAHTYAVELFTSASTLPAKAVSAAAAAALATPTAIAAALPRHWRELTRCFSEMCEEVVAGQYLEFLLAHRAHSAPPAPHPQHPQHLEHPEHRAGAPQAPGAAAIARESELLRILRLKSGRYTAERPIQLGALLAGAPPEVRAELSRYGTAVGEAFQLQDDLLGLFGDAATVGKPVGDDLREGKFTLVIHHALATASPADSQLIHAALGKPNLSAAEVAGVQQVLERTGARRAVTAMIGKRLAEARRALDALADFDLAPHDPLSMPASPATAQTAATKEPHAGAEREGALFLAGLLDYLWERER